MPSKLNLPNKLLSLVICLYPSKTWIKTPGWLSAYFVNICDFFVGIVVFLGIKTVITPPAVSIPRDSGVTSSRTHELTCYEPSPDKIAAWTAAP